MIDLDFAVTGAEIAPRSATPLLLLKMRIDNRTPEVPVEHVMLQAQIRIEAARRDYGAAERERLFDLFGGAADWSRSLRGLLWTNVSVPVPAFAESCEIDLPVPCSCDFDIAATRYFDGVAEGAAPLSLLFSGAIFFRDDGGYLQIAQVPHHKEAGWRLPVGLWREAMERYYADTVWLRVGRDVHDEIGRYRRRHGLPTVEDALRRLLRAEGER